MISYKLVQGDTLSYLVNAPTGDDVTYTPADGWTLKYRLVPRSSAGSPIDLTATTSGEQYQVAAPAADTATWGTGWYGVAAWVEKGTERYTVEPVFEQVEILPNPATLAAGYDSRSLARKALDDARQAFADAQARAAAQGATGNAIGGVVEYQIGDRRMKYASAQEAKVGLLAAISYWTTEVKREERDSAIARGQYDPAKVYLRMGNA